MATYRKVPARIMTVDYVGITTEDSVKYRKLADRELNKLEQRVLRGELKQGHSRRTLADNVVVECSVIWQLKQAIVYVGRDRTEKRMISECYCCSPCLVAGLIIDIYTEEVDEEEKPIYNEDKHFYADVVICQSGSPEMPKTVTLQEETSIGGSMSRSERILSTTGHGTEINLKAAYAYKHEHQIGDSVLVLVMPINSFTPYPGEYMDCINKRQIANGAIPNPLPVISEAYINSTGMSCKIQTDEQLWDETLNDSDDPPNPLAEWKYYPYRILPIGINSCLT